MTPTEEFVGRLKSLSKEKLISESAVCKRAGVSRSIIAAARQRQNGMGWNEVAAIASVLQEDGFSRDWILFGEGPPTSGNVVRLGDKSRDIAVPIEASPSKKHGHQRASATANDAPRASQNSRRAKSVRGGHVDHR